MNLSLAQGEENGRPYHLITARWQVVEKNGIGHVYTEMNDDNPQTYVSAWNYGEYNPQTGQASVELIVPDYYQSGTYSVNFLSMRDVAGNYRNVFFTNTDHNLGSVDIRLDEPPATIEIQTKNPDSTPPILDLNQITIKAEPTHPESPNGETQVDITFRIKDDISGYKQGDLRLRDPQGTIHAFYHSDEDIWKVYFSRDPTIYQTYHQTVLLPIGSVPGTWGLAEMVLLDKAGNRLQADFTEIVHFEVEEGAPAAPVIASLPVTTQLHPNYPNPFNPETWIPYQLANSSDVQIIIYDTRGILVRTLALGYQTAGYYTGRSHAAYWDGCNGLGERVASGIYFYQLQTDETSLLRKMVILK